MANISKPLNQGFAAPNIVANYGPYASVPAAHTALSEDGLNVVGMTVGIKTGDTITEYWYQGGTTQSHLVQKHVSNNELDALDSKFTTAINNLENITGDSLLVTRFKVVWNLLDSAEDIDTIINKFHEIVNFLEGIDENRKLKPILDGITSLITEKANKSDVYLKSETYTKDEVDAAIEKGVTISTTENQTSEKLVEGTEFRVESGTGVKVGKWGEVDNSIEISADTDVLATKTELTAKADKADTYTKEQVDAVIENVAFLGDDDGQAVIPEFDPQTDTLLKTTQSLTNTEKETVIGNILDKNYTGGSYIGKGKKYLKLNVGAPVATDFDGFVDGATTEQSSLAEVPDNIYFDRTNNIFIASKGEGLLMKYYMSWQGGDAYMNPNSGVYFKNGNDYYQWNGTTLEAATVGNVNRLTQADFDSANTIYVIRYDFDLCGQSITIPENCVLEFDGGSLSNGCLQSNKNIIINSSAKCLDNITFGGQCVYSFIPKLIWYIDKYPTSTLDSTIDNTSEVRQCINCGCRSVEFPIDRFVRLTNTIIVNKPVNIVTNNSNVPYLTPISVDKTTERLSMRPCIFSNVVTTLFDFNLHNFVENENYNNAFTIGNITLLSTVNFTEVTQESVATPILRIKSELENGGTQKFIDLYCHVGVSRCNVAIDEEDKTDGGDTTYSACNFTGIEVVASNSSISFLQVHGSIEYCFIGVRLKRAQNNNSDWFNDVILYGNTHCCFGCISDAGGKLIVYGTHQSMRMPTRLNTWNGYIEADSVFLYGYVWDVHGNYIKDNSHKMLMAKSQCYNRDIYANGKFYVEPTYSDNKLPSQYMPNPTIITKHITGKNDIREMSNILYQGVTGNGMIKDMSYKIKFNDEAELIESLFTDRIINSYCLFNDHIYHNPRISGDRGYSYITTGGIDTAYVNKQLSQIQVSFIIQTRNTLFDNYYYPLILLIGLSKRSGADNSFSIVVKTKDKDSTEYTTILNSSNNAGLEFGGMYYKFDITKLGILDDIEITITFNYSGDTNVMKRILPFISIPWPFGDVSKYRYFTDGKRPVVDAYNKGVTSFNADDNKPVYWTGTRWVDSEGFSADALRKGTTSERPIGLHDVNGLPVGVLTSDDIGFLYFDTTLGKLVCVKNVNSDGTVVWIDETGVVAGTPTSGTFANKPTVATNNIPVGFKYFCTDKQTTEGATDGIEIIHKGNDVWVDALGRTIS